jgi:hypothetical protein
MYAVMLSVPCLFCQWSFHNVITLLLQFILRKPVNVTGTSYGYFNVIFQEYYFIIKDLITLKCVCLSDQLFSQN